MRKIGLKSMLFSVALVATTALAFSVSADQKDKETHKHRRVVRQEYRQLMKDNKIAKADVEAIEKKQTENRAFSKSAAKDGMQPAEKDQVKANQAAVEKMMEDAVAKAKMTAPTTASAPATTQPGTTAPATTTPATTTPDTAKK